LKRPFVLGLVGWAFLGLALGALPACGLFVGTGLMSWTVQFQGPLTADPEVAGNAVFVPAGSGFHCLGAAQGDSLWNHPDVPGGFGGRPRVMGDRVATWAGKLMVLDRNNGSEVWSENLPNAYSVSGGQIACASANGFKIKDLDKGKDLWLGDLGTGKAVTALFLDGDRLYVVYQKSPVDPVNPAGIQAWDTTAQSMLWDTDLTAPPVYPPVLGGERLYLVLPHTGQTEMAALDRKTGGIRWSFKTEPFKSASQSPVPFVSLPAADANAVVFTSRDGSGHSLQSLLPDTGQRLWRFFIDWPLYEGKSPLPVLTRPLLGRQSVVFGAGKRLARVDPLSGRLRSVFEADAFLRADPALGDDGTAYFGTASGRFYATK